jgi:hypothetical protein
MPSKTFRAIAKRDPNTGRTVLSPTGRPIIEQFIIEPEKKYVRPYWMDSKPIELVLAPLGAAGDSDDVEFLIDKQGHFDWNSIIGSGTAPYTIEFFDVATNRRLQNRPVHNATVVGSGARPFYLPEPYFFNVGQSQRVLRARLQNLSLASNTVRLALYGRRFYHYEAPREITEKFLEQFGNADRVYSYFLTPYETTSTGEVETVAAGATTTFRFTSDSEADTVITKLMAATDPPLSSFEFIIRERTTNRLIMNNPVLANQGWGNAEFPMRLADSYLLERQKDWIMELTNTSGAAAKFYLTLAALKVHFDPFV